MQRRNGRLGTQRYPVKRLRNGVVQLPREPVAFFQCRSRFRCRTLTLLKSDPLGLGFLPVRDVLTDTPHTNDLSLGVADNTTVRLEPADGAIRPADSILQMMFSSVE